MAVSKKHVKEIIKCGKDPVYFFNQYGKIQHPLKGLIPFNTFDFQDDCVDYFNEERFNIILKSRQLGISTLTAAYSVWLALFYKDKNILVIATKMAVAMNFIKKTKVFIKNLPPWLIIPEIVHNTKQSIEFSNGSQIKAVPTSDDAGRSEALSLLIVDEAAFIRNFEELWTGLYPTLSTGGRAIVLSTPNGVGNQYHTLYSKADLGENIFNPIVLPWDVHPERDEEWFERETANMSKKQIAQELLCDFAASGDTFMTIDDLEYIRTMVRSPIERWGYENNCWTWKYALSGHKYIVSADVATGTGADYSAFHVIDIDESEIVCEFKGKMQPDRFALLMAEAGRRYNNAVLCPEVNSWGYACVMKLKEINYENLYFSSNKDRMSYMYDKDSFDLKKIGFMTKGSNREKILTKLDEVLRNKNLKVYSSRFYDELKTFVWKGKRLQAQKGSHDDLIMALAIGTWLFEADANLSKSSYDVNKAMLAGFGVNKTDDKPDDMSRLWDVHRNNPTRVFFAGDGVRRDMTNTPYGDMSWIIK
jgi:hypothetical protein